MEYSQLAFKERRGPPVWFDFNRPIVNESGEPEYWPLWDYVIDGRWWAEIEAAADGRSDPDGYWWGKVSPLGWTTPEFQEDFLKQFPQNGVPMLKGGRTVLGVCHIDADLLCGTMSCVVTHLDDRVEWTEFGRDWFEEADLENIGTEVTWPDLRFSFEPAQYERAFRALRELMRDYANSERFRRFEMASRRMELDQDLAEFPFPLLPPLST